LWRVCSRLGLPYTAFIIVRYNPSIPSFIMKVCWILSKAFSVSIEILKWFLSLLLSIPCNKIHYLHMLNHPCITGIKLTWPWWLIFVICFFIWFVIILLRIFVPIFIKEIGL
jgi:hypothetical protein